MGALFYI